MSIESREVGPKKILTTSQMFETWIRQEGNRYENLLTERGFLREEERGNDQAIYEASCEWRKTYIADLGLENKEWQMETVEQPGMRAKTWFLGGWAGWKGYRPDGARFTTFEDVVRGIIHHKSGIPPHHLEGIPSLAAKANDLSSGAAYFLLSCGGDIAVLEGTNRLAALVYAAQMNMFTPSRLNNVYRCDLPLEKQQLFYRFCEDRPVIKGKYA